MIARLEKFSGLYAQAAREAYLGLPRQDVSPMDSLSPLAKAAPGPMHRCTDARMRRPVRQRLALSAQRLDAQPLPTTGRFGQALSARTGCQCLRWVTSRQGDKERSAASAEKPLQNILVR